MEEELLRVKKFESDAILARGGIAHDYNNLLSVICAICDYGKRGHKNRMWDIYALWLRLKEEKKRLLQCAKYLTHQLLKLFQKEKRISIRKTGDLFLGGLSTEKKKKKKNKKIYMNHIM